MNETTETARLVRATVSNVLGIKFAEVEFDKDGGMIVVGGENGAGKSSLIEALRWNLDGVKPHRKKLLHRGQEKGSVVMKLAGTIIEEVRRTVTEKNDYLKLTRPDGEEIKKAPAGKLKSLVGTHGIDPSTFIDLTDKQQTERVQKVMGLDLDDLDEEYNLLDEKRTNANRRVRDAEGEIKTLPPADGVPTEKVVVSDLLEQIDMVDKREKARVADVKALEDLREKNATLKTTIKEAEEALASLMAERGDLITQGKQLAEKVAANAEEATVEISECRDSENLRAKLRDAETINERVEVSVRRTIAEGKLEGLKVAADKHKTDLETLAKTRAERIAAAPVSIPGIDIRDGVVYYAGKPFGDQSDGEQLLTAFEIAAAGDPELKVLFMRHGSKLDAKNRQAVAEKAMKRGYTVVMEVVGTDGIDIHMENGVAR